jgi:hypothetical protein
MRDEELAAEAKRLIDVIASRPRFAGSAEEAEARRFCAAELDIAGLTVTEKTFEYSQWPGRWGIPFIAAGTLAEIVAIAFATRANPIFGSFACSLSIIAFSVASVRRRSATRKLRWLRSSATNLEAVAGEPDVWLVAHLDSKSQTIPMLVRVISHIVLVAVLLIVFGAFILVETERAHDVPWIWLLLAGVIAALPSLFCIVGNNSRGALDNATGVAAVLLASRMISNDKAFGVLITSGEELDLAGARAWTEERHKGAMMINCDTVDDEGAWRCMYAWRPHAISRAGENAAKKLGLGLRMGMMIPGIITDSLAFETAGLRSVTLSRGTLRTLARLHTRGDSPDRVNGSGAAMAARMLTHMVEELV